MTGPELDALIARAEKAISGNYLSQADATSLVSELKTYRIVTEHLQQLVEEMRKELD